MTRCPPRVDAIPPVPDVAPQRDGWQTWQREYELITPLFGGGPVAREADPLTLVRGSAIRGQLRFWWRACRAARYGDGPDSLVQLKQAEDLLWGAAGRFADEDPEHPAQVRPGPARVHVLVTSTGAGHPAWPFEIARGKVDSRGQARPRLEAREDVAPAYAAFPLQPTDAEVQRGGIGMRTHPVQVGVRFHLTVSFEKAWHADNPHEQALFGNPDDPAHPLAAPADEVAAALWAWETFGGLGGRTRRGFGALGRRDDPAALPAGPADAARWLKQGLATHVLKGKAHRDLPYLARAGVLPVPGSTPGPNDIVRFAVLNRGWHRPHDAWRYLIERLRQFRQMRSKGNTGRSLWPEADAIRRATGFAAPPFTSGLVEIDSYPRAALGLPIVFHFKDERAGDPPDTTLQRNEKERERLASPLILRPLACANGQAVGLAVALRAPGPGAGKVELSSKVMKKPVSAEVDDQQATALAPLAGQKNVVQAFLRTLK